MYQLGYIQAHAIDENSTGPCYNYKEGNDDLETFDFIRKFHLDDINTTGIVKVHGSSPTQTAFRIENESHLTLPTRKIFPHGLPNQFSLIYTFRCRKVPKTIWYFIGVTDNQSRPQFLIALNPKRQTIEFSLPNYRGELQTVIFENINIFNKNWHKVHFGVFNEYIVLFIDCNFISRQILELRGPISTDGVVWISKQANSKNSMPIDLQWMVMSCDPSRPERENCAELPAALAVPATHLIGPAPSHFARCNVTCPRGPPGYNGTHGLPGFKGDIGPRGLQGYPGLDGLRGDIGEKGDLGPMGPPGISGNQGPPGFPGLEGRPGQDGIPGSQGPPGQCKHDHSLSNEIHHNSHDQVGPRGYPGEPGRPGERGQFGERGSIGPMGAPGFPGKDGESGIPGTPGQRGPSGLPGPSGVSGHGSVSESEIREICSIVLKEQLKELSSIFVGPPGPPGHGRPGRTGAPGLQGPPGNPGIPGFQGERGFIGPQGLPGLPGPTGESGEKGENGERGPEGVGVEGPIGPRGAQGSPGIAGEGLPGRAGERGESGRPGSSGQRGLPGPQGAPGYCEFCNNYVQHYQQAYAQGNNKGP